MQLYRFEKIVFEDHVGVIINTYQVTKETPCGYWIGGGSQYTQSGKRWVSKTAMSRFAYPTKKEALVNFKRRTNRYINILNNRKVDAQQSLITAEIEFDLNGEKKNKGGVCLV